jgi:8-amino-7-oxononanoate synthase
MLFATRVDGWKAMYTLFRRAESPRPARIIVGGRELIWYGSTDYLGLSHDPRVIEAATRALERYGTRAGYRALNGTLDLHEEFESELAQFKGAEAALVFSGGYLGNISILTALLKTGDVIFVDEKAHASLVDGSIFSGAKMVRFRHNSAQDLSKKIDRNPNSRSLIVVDGVYSIEGNLVCLPEIYGVARVKGIPLMVDDAHGFGVMGHNGAGTTEHFGLMGLVDLDVGTLSKSLGGIGGFVTCRKHIKDYLQHASKGFTFTVTLPAVVMAGVMETLKIIKTDFQRRAKLWSNVNYLKDGLKTLGYKLDPTDSAVMAVTIGNEKTAFDFVRMLEDRGVCVGPVFRPMTRKGEAKIRLSLTAAHSEQDLTAALDAFRDLKSVFDAKMRGELG